MLISRIRLRAGLTPREIGKEIAGGDTYEEHQLIWSFFGDCAEGERAFLYRRCTDVSWMQFYTVSSTPPNAPSGNWEVAAKVYKPVLKPGSRLSFVLRVNPVVATRDENNRQHRYDIVMHERHKLLAEGKAKDELSSRAEIAQRVGYEWLAQRGERLGFKLEPSGFVVEGYNQVRFTKRKSGHIVRLGVMDVRGVLQVTESDAIMQTLYRGIGPAKSFGCGLMLVKRA